MNTIDIKRASFQEVFAQIEGLRFLVWAALKKHGPCTTRQLAEYAELDILTVRPRVTELCDLGFAELSGKAGREGLYRARTYIEAAKHHAALSPNERQLYLAI